MVIKKEQFIWDFYNSSKSEICSCLHSVSFKDIEFINSDNFNNNDKHSVYYVSLFPGFLKSKLKWNKKYVLKKLLHTNLSGLGIEISGFNSVEEYLINSKKNDLLKNVSKKKRRLEKDFMISYEHNYGAITKDKCEKILNQLRTMIFKRWDKNVSKHTFMKEWDKNTKNLTTSINDKKSSIFVVYANNVPISIQLNRLIDGKILNCLTHSYDVEYGKYGIGNLNYFINLDWCIQNQISFMDLGNGVTYIKNKWSNYLYDMYYLVIYKKKHPTAFIVAYLEIVKIKLKNFIKFYIYNFRKPNMLKKKAIR